MTSFGKLIAASIAVAALVAACGSTAATQTPAAPGGPAAGATTVMAKTIGGASLLVDGGSGFTLYLFASDTAGSGKSACTGSCATTWPPLTVASGTTPNAGAGASGTLGTIKRDDGTTQVTYNGSPVYHYSGDSASGDTNGNYPGWSPVKA
jgi:predicted lipoprotein with Yx(FWY)xxD motif